jgi:hypothetical protein
MTNKIISSVILTTSIVFSILAAANPNNLLFLFASSNDVISISRLILAVGMVLLSFKGLVNNKEMKLAVKYLGLVLILFGGLSMLITPLGSAIYNYVKLLDVMIIAEAGVIFTSCAITLPQVPAKAPARRKKAATATASPKLRHKTA